MPQPLHVWRPRLVKEIQAAVRRVAPPWRDEMTVHHIAAALLGPLATMLLASSRTPFSLPLVEQMANAALDAMHHAIDDFRRRN